MAIAEVQHLLHHIRDFSVTTIAPRRQQISRIGAPSCRFPEQPTRKQAFIATVRTSGLPNSACCLSESSLGSLQRVTRSAPQIPRIAPDAPAPISREKAIEPSGQSLEFRPKEADSVEVEQQVDKTEVQEHWHDRPPVLARQEV